MRDTGLNPSGVPVGALPTVEVGDGPGTLGLRPARHSEPHGLYALQGFSGVGVSPSVCPGPAKVCSVQYALDSAARASDLPPRTEHAPHG